MTIIAYEISAAIKHETVINIKKKISQIKGLPYINMNKKIFHHKQKT